MTDCHRIFRVFFGPFGHSHLTFAGINQRKKNMRKLTILKGVILKNSSTRYLYEYCSHFTVDNNVLWLSKM